MLVPMDLSHNSQSAIPHTCEITKSPHTCESTKSWAGAGSKSHRSTWSRVMHPGTQCFGQELRILDACSKERSIKKRYICMKPSQIIGSMRCAMSQRGLSNNSFVTLSLIVYGTSFNSTWTLHRLHSSCWNLLFLVDVSFRVSRTILRFHKIIRSADGTLGMLG